MTKRIYDENGWLFIPKNPISKAGVFPYRGAEIGAQDAQKIYNVLRSPDELKRSAHTFQLLPIIDEHELLGSLGTSTDARPSSGTTGENVEYEHPYLFASLKITSDALQKEIARGKIELSPAYACDWIEENGTYNGTPYEYKQIIKHGNHLALVEKGRTGADVAVLDSFAFDSANSRKGDGKMSFEEILAAIAELSEAERAALLEALAPKEDKVEVEPKEEAKDEEQKEMKEGEEKAEDEDEENVEASATAKEGEEVEGGQELMKKISQDAMIKAVKHIDARNSTVSKVRPFIGAIPASAMDSAESVAAYALGKIGVKHQKGQACSVLNGYLHGRKPANQKTAQDSAIKKSGKVDVNKFGWSK